MAVDVKDRTTKEVVCLRLREAHAECLAGCVVHRLHRDASNIERPTLNIEGKRGSLDINREESDALNQDVRGRR